ncbi:metal ABC transporter permease [Rhabdochlamydiaceae symbiont of Dictyostelium giganteum]|uniref:metal ABC transporter permease n=1 Tax=Rhabdochlamydiaceae symbiont of Dictyostelium giganteum TaxID=3342349 RepID=UPI00384EAB86
MNPYWGSGFFDFFSILFYRLMGKMPLSQLAPDEVQLIILLCITISMGLLGVFLSLRKMTMLANSLSHTTLLGIVLCFLLLKTPVHTLMMNPLTLLLSSLISCCLTLILTELSHKLFKLQEDASIGLVFTTLFALSILLITVFTRNAHLGTEVITGNVDALSIHDIPYTVLSTLGITLVTCLFYRAWVISAFDVEFAYLAGFSIRFHHIIQLFLTALALIVSMRAVGVLLALSFLISPVLIARQWSKKVSSLLFLSLSLGLSFSFLGVALSRHILSYTQVPVSTGGLIVTLLSLAYFVSTALTFRQKIRFNDSTPLSK